MAKKRFSKHQPATPSKKRRQRGDNRNSPAFLADRIIAYLADRNDSVSMGALVAALDLPRHTRKTVKEVMANLEKQKKISRSDKKYRLSGDGGLVRAVLELNSRGFGFAIVEGAGPGAKDPFIARPNLNGASHQDTVLIQLKTGRGRPEARVIKILRRGITRLCGIYTASGKTGFVTPDNDRLPFTVRIRRGNSLGAANDQAVLVELLNHGIGGRPPEGKVLEILGDPLLVSVQIRMAIEQFELDQDFPADVRREAEELQPLSRCEDGRADLRHIAHVTIDGATAKDFDDAVCVEKTKNGYRLYVSIADVSHYVRPGTAIDREAYRRGTSVYFPGRVIPMLPERLSNDLCSLVPDQDRPAFTAILDFNKKGRRTGQKFCRSLIRSHQRFTYNTVREIVYDRAAKVRKKYKGLLAMLDHAARLADLLWQQREQRGSIGFDIPEPEIHLRGDRIELISRAERNQAHKLIEECMLAANEAVAATLMEKNMPVLYRIHERPDPLKVERFTEATAAMGFDLPRFELTPAWFARVVKEAQNTPAQYVLSNLMLRTMQQARYSPENAGHFGLAAENYLHFTSPIRRYPDLVAHRVLQNLLSRTAKTKKQAVLPGGASLDEAAVFLSRRERIAVDVERNTQARLSALYLHDRIGDEFDAVVSGVASFGLFVELLETFISGAVPVAEMTDDYYILDSSAHKYIGERTGRVFQMGDLLRVRLDRVDMAARKITFSLVAAGDDDSA